MPGSKIAPGASLRSLAILALLAAAVFLAALLVGSSGIPLPRVLAALAGGGDEATRTVLREVRLPRVLAGFGVGSLLALSGVLLQALFRNSLADPYVLGVSGGAAIGALLVGLADNFGKALFPELSYFTLYAPMVLILAIKPTGLFGRD